MNFDLNLEEINIFEPFNNTSPSPSTEDMTPSVSENMTPSVSEDLTPSVSENMTPSPSTEDLTPSVSENMTPSPSTEDMTPSPSTEDMTPSPSTENMTPSQSGGSKFDKMDLDRGSILDIGDNKKYIAKHQRRLRNGRSECC